MNNVIDRNYTPVSRRDADIYKEALGERIGIERYGFFLLPMDEALILSHKGYHFW